jgi:hypothetical protein
MTKWAPALACGIVVFAGCGGSSNSDSATRTHSPAEVAAACEKIGAARQGFVNARAALGLNVSRTPVLRSALAATEAFRLSAAELQRVTAGRDLRTATRLVTSLSELEKELRAFEAHNLPEAQKYGNKLNIPLQQALVKLDKIC